MTDRSRPLRVLQIIAGLAIEGPLGGIERFCVDLVRALDPDKISPVVCGLWDYDTPFEQRWRERLHENHIDVFLAAPKDEHSPYSNFIQALSTIRARVQDQVDIIHSHSEFGDVAALLLRRSLGARAIIRTVHNGGVEWQRGKVRRMVLTNSLYPYLFDMELGVAPHIVERLDNRPFARILHRKAKVVYNALDISRFVTAHESSETTRHALGIPTNAQVVGSVGRLVPGKGIEVLLQAATHILRQRPDTYFLIVGEGNLRKSLQAQAHQLEIAENVIFTGPQSEIEAIYGAMDVFVSPSLWEGLPTVILEAMAAGIPVVAAQNPGSENLIKHEQTGFLVEPRQPDQLSNAVLHVLDTPSNHDDMLHRARQHVLHNFAIGPIARKHEEIYQQLVSRK